MAVDVAERPTTLVDVRCRFCYQLMFRAEPPLGRVEVVCANKRCRRYQVVTLAAPA